MIAQIILGLAVITFGLAAYTFWISQTANQNVRGALFTTERQMADTRTRQLRSRAIGFLGAGGVLLVISASVAMLPAPGPAPTPTPTLKSTLPLPTRTSTPTQAPTPSTLPSSPAPTIAPAITPTATALMTATVSGTDALGLRLRQEPNGADITYLSEGTVVELLPDPTVTTNDGIVWQKVRDSQGREGWVAAAFLTKP
jgi:Bacterial SH3 domain